MGRRIQIFVTNNWGRELFGYFVLIVLSIGAIYLFYYLIFELKIRNPSRYIWLFVITGLYIYFTLKLWKIPEEAIHFLEYGLLGFFLFKALSHNIKDKSIFFTATLFALFIGTFDEIFQWIIPERYWDFRDVGLNGLSGGLFQLAIWKVMRPKFISEKFSAKSLKIFTSIFVGCFIILGLCVSNTPNRVYNYTTQIPFLSFLQKEEAMSEFGYKHTDQEIGTFYSRLSPRKLHKTDNQKGEEYAQILNESIDKDYKQFIREYSPTTAPFMHEIRVHIFRRDRYFNKGEKTSNMGERKESYFTAYKENLILKKYFTRSIKNSVYWWSKERVEEVKTLIEEDKPYESPVSSNLSTSFSEKTAWTAIFSLIAALLVVNLFFKFKKP